MKKRLLMVVGCVLAATALCAPALLASDPIPADRAPLNLALVEENVVVGLNSGVPGVQADLAQLVRDLKDLYPEYSFSSVTIPLMGILRDESAATPVRVMAALALDELESAVGDYAIAQLPRFTDDARLQYICAALTQRRMKQTMSVSQEIASIDPIPEEGE
jgi:hypothetical protein